MGYYRVCEICGANLDPGERCSDCYPVQEERNRPKMISITTGKARKSMALRSGFREKKAQ